MKSLLLAGCSIALLCSCGDGNKNQTRGNASGSIKYAEGFRVSDHTTYKEVEVIRPFKGARAGYRYLLVQKGADVPDHDPSVQVITIPLESIVCTSTTHIPLLDYLNESEKLTGFPTTDYISSAKTRKRVDAGFVAELGMDKGMNIEKLVSLQPSMVMGYAMTGDLGQLKKIREMGIPVVVNAEYLERHPLGRAEWIKFMALFFNKERQADSVFKSIESEYLKTMQRAESTSSRPTIMSGIVYGDTWFLPGGQNYAAQLLQDAGAKYLWRQDSTTSFLELSFESVFAKASRSDFWIGVGSFETLNQLKASEERYATFQPFRIGTVYTYNARKGAKGGSEFLELGYLRPDIILKDLVKILHPETEPDYELYFHRKLK